MNHKQLILSTLKGESTEAIPYIPRLDIWYNANSRNGTLPGKYKNATLLEIVDDLDLGYHSIIPAFRDFADKEGDVDIGLCIHTFRSILYSVELQGIDKKITRQPDGLTVVEYGTPHGTIRTGVKYDEQMRKGGATLSATLEHAVKGLDDFEALAYIFENAKVKPNYLYFQEYKDSVVGDRGVAVGYANIFACPMHFLLKELMSVETFFYELYDHPEEMEWLAGKLSGFCDKVFEISSNSPAELILSGGNYDSTITTPPIFKKYIAPELKKQADILHAKGKYLVTHTDGENTGLLDSYLESGFDVADSICPDPMTRLTLKEVKDKLNGKITIWGGIPSISVLEDSMTEYEFEKYMNMTLESIGRGDHLIFSIADTTPPGAKFDRIIKIAKMIKDFGPVKMD
jgi:hypothetical protein